MPVGIDIAVGVGFVADIVAAADAAVVVDVVVDMDVVETAVEAVAYKSGQEAPEMNLVSSWRR